MWRNVWEAGKIQRLCARAWVPACEGADEDKSVQKQRATADNGLAAEEAGLFVWWVVCWWAAVSWACDQMGWGSRWLWFWSAAGAVCGAECAAEYLRQASFTLWQMFLRHVWGCEACFRLLQTRQRMQVPARAMIHMESLSLLTRNSFANL